jgi:hypothetical protein
MKSKIILSSDYHYANLVAEIYINEKYIALVSYDDKKNFFVETPTNNLDDAYVNHKIPYEVFINLLDDAKRKLLQEE